MKKIIPFFLLLLFNIACGDNSVKLSVTTHLRGGQHASGSETLTLAAGCFWCVEAVYQQLDGVQSVTSGYMSGHTKNPTYQQVSSKNTGHAEVVQIIYNPKVISSDKILNWFWKIHDPTSKNRQGSDVGHQYRSEIFYHTEEQKNLALASLKGAQKNLQRPIVTKITPASTYYKAEARHQDFYLRNKSTNEYCRFVIGPKLKKLNLRP